MKKKRKRRGFILTKQNGKKKNKRIRHNPYYAEFEGETSSLEQLKPSGVQLR